MFENISWAVSSQVHNYPVTFFSISTVYITENEMDPQWKSFEWHLVENAWCLYNRVERIINYYYHQRHAVKCPNIIWEKLSFLTLGLRDESLTVLKSVEQERKAFCPKRNHSIDTVVLNVSTKLVIVEWTVQR